MLFANFLEVWQSEQVRWVAFVHFALHSLLPVEQLPQQRFYWHGNSDEQDHKKYIFHSEFLLDIFVDLIYDWDARLQPRIPR